jgi:hypothetical protein
MSPAETAPPRRTPEGLWPARSRAEVSFYLGERQDVERVVRRLFGRALRRWEYAGLAGAPDDARVELGACDGQLYLETSDPLANRYRTFHLARRAAARLVIVNEGFCIQVETMQRSGLGLRVFYRQVENAAALGVDRIEAIAGRCHGENGYYTWPRFGFDGPLPGSVKANLPLGLERACRVLDLMECDKGRLWWREHGCTIRVTFDLAAGSRSQSALERYVGAKLQSGGAETIVQ